MNITDFNCISVLMTKCKIKLLDEIGQIELDDSLIIILFGLFVFVWLEVKELDWS